jgi:NADPH:quinone reductase-like Zn-dependent oxidoreductase
MQVRQSCSPSTDIMEKTMRVIRFHKSGGPEVLKVEDVPLPEPNGREVSMRVHAIALSRVDILWREGSYFEEPVLPAGIGYDAAGVVEAVGPEVRSLKVGDQVSTFPAVSLLNYTAHGETVVYPEDALLVYPQNLSSEQAAAVNTGLFAAYFALVELSGLRPDQHVVITAASSSMGIAAIQVAKALGAKSIAVTRSEGKRQHLETVGADHVIVAGIDDVQEAVLEITAGDGVDVVYDGVGGPGLEELVWATKRFGHVIVYGYLGAMEHTTPLPLGACFLRGLNLHTSYKIFDFTGHPRLRIPPNREAIERAKKFVFDGLASELFKPKINRVFVGLDNYAAAHDYMSTNVHTGKIIVSLNEAIVHPEG